MNFRLEKPTSVVYNILMKGKKAGNEYTDILMQKGARKWIQSLASAWKISEDQVPERIVRAGLEAYLAERKVGGSHQRQDKHFAAGSKR
jgi:hypothetical protein